jgi:MYXO-CTERM domain-containing protein
MIRTLAIAAALAAITAAAPASATTYSFAYHTGTRLLANTREASGLRDRSVLAIKAIDARPTSTGARSVSPHRVNLHGLLGVTSVALGSAIDGSLQNFCAAMQADCRGVGFAVVTSLAPLDGFDFTSANSLFASYLVKSRPTPARVPEPGSWALWIAGFGALGMMQRRRATRIA